MAAKALLIEDHEVKTHSRKAAMKVLRDLTGKVVEASPAVSGGAFALHNEPVPGFIRQMRMGGTGILLVSQGTELFVPIEELWALAEKVAPCFRPPAAKPARRPTGRR